MINREHSYEIMEEIIEHWSPRAFDPNKGISKEELMAILEAARFAPSCFNEQPWSYVVGHDQEEKSKVLSVLAPSNQEWAKNASALLIILSHKQFKHNNKDNRWNQFDAGTAWGYLALEAQRRGVITHAMGGFSVDKARDVFNIPEEYDVIAALAVGYMGDLEVLSKENQEREKPSERKPLENLIFNK